MNQYPPELEKAEELLEAGRRLLDEGRLAEAEKRFRKAYRCYPLPAALNNWAMCRHLAGDHQGALALLEPLLQGTDPVPYSRALAARACHALGDTQGAAAALQAAIRDLDRGLRDPDLAGPAREMWIEYTLFIKQTAGILGQHRLVLELHNRWPGREEPAAAFYAGVAAFNLGRYEQAARHWRRATHPAWIPVLEAFAQVAELVALGEVPPFPLEYQDHPAVRLKKPLDEEMLATLPASGSVRMRILALLFDPKAPERRALAQGLVLYTGEWGLDLGRRLLSSNRVDLPVKLGAALALVERGVFREEEPIPAVVDGRPTTLSIRPVEMKGFDSELDRKLKEAIRLRDAGDEEAAYRLLLEMEESGHFYPPAMMTLANLMRRRGELDEAQLRLEAVERFAPDEPAVLFNLAGLWLQRCDLERAADYLSRIPRTGLRPDLAAKVAELEAYLSAELAADRLGEIWREEEDEKPIRPNITLLTALSRVPVQWLNAAAAAFGLPPVRLRKERARRLAEAMRDPERLREVLAQVSPEARDALRYVLDQGGWCKLSALTRRFGSQEGDGFWWDEQPPTSPIGQLRARCLLMVGRAALNGRRHRIAVVPAELRPLLATVLATGGDHIE